MNYNIKDVNGCTKLISFNFESVDLSTEINTSLKQKQKTAKLKGFRVGKVPLSMIQEIYGPQIENEALYSFVSKEFYNAVDKEGLKPVGYPKFDNTKYESDSKNIAFEATVEIFPEFEIKDYSSFTFKRDEDAVTSEDLEEVKKQYLNSKSELKAIEDTSQALEKGQFAILNFEGEKEDGSRPDNMKGQDFSLEIGSGQFIPGFEDAMIGMKSSEKKTIDLTFPESYHAEDLKGAKVKFHVELLEIKEKSYPEFNDDFVKQFEFESVSDFEKKTQDRIGLEKTRKADEKLHQEILEKLVEENKFDLPSAMIANQAKALQEETARSLAQNGFNQKMIEDYFVKWGDDFNSKAEFQVRSGLILNQLADKFSIETNDEDVNAKFEEMAKTSSMELEKVKELYGQNENVLKNLQYAIKEEKTFAKLKEQMSIN